MHQSLHHWVADAPWNDEEMLAAVRQYVLPTMQKHGAVVAWIVDDTGFPKQGKHSVGVTRLYCGQVGKQDNCQVAVSLSVSTWNASLPIAWRLYLPEVWCQDAERCQQAGVPEGVEFQTKPEIALQQIRQALQQQVPVGVILADAGYGHNPQFRTSLSELGLHYIGGIETTTSVGTGQTTLAGPAAKAGSWSNPHPSAAHPKSSADFGATVGSGVAIFGLEGNWLAARQSGNSPFSFCRCARATSSSRREARHAAPGRMAFDRMAEGSIGTYSILAVQLTCHNFSEVSGKASQTSLGHRTRL